MQQNKINNSEKPFLTGTLHDIKSSLRGKVRTLEEVHDILLSADPESDFVQILKEHHRFLEESIVVLMDKESEPSEKQLHLERFLRLLDMHAKAEEETLYIALQQNTQKEARLEGFFGQDEHDIAAQLAEELRAMNFSLAWSEEIDAKAKVIASLVKNHIKVEESEMFKIAEKDMDEERLQELTGVYIEKCLDLLEAPPVAVN